MQNNPLILIKLRPNTERTVVWRTAALNTCKDLQSSTVKMISDSSVGFEYSD